VQHVGKGCPRLAATRHRARPDTADKRIALSNNDAGNSWRQAMRTSWEWVTGEALEAGVVVISFDGIVTEPCAWRITVDFRQMGRDQAAYLAERLSEGVWQKAVADILPSLPHIVSVATKAARLTASSWTRSFPATASRSASRATTCRSRAGERSS